MRNIEALRNYFLGKDPQLEVVLSDNSLRLSGIEGKHYILRGELIKRLTDLKTAMEEADEALQGSIDDLNLWKDTTPFVLDSDLATALSNYYTKTQVDNLLSVIPRFSIEVVAQLPTQDISTTTIYLAPSEDPQTANAYDEFIYVNNSWEQIGSTAIDMSDYYTKEEVNAKTFINTLTQDITIPENSELNPLLLSTGWWYTGEHVIYYGESVEPTIHNNALFYFNAEAGDQWFYFLPPNLDDGWNRLGTYLWFDNTDHIWQYSGYGVVTTIDNHSTDMSIPTAGAVYEFVNGSGVIKELTSPVTIWGLEDGVYLLPASCEVRYGGGMYWTGSKALLFVGTENATTKRYFIFDGSGTQNTITNGKTTSSSGTIKYFSVGLDYETTSNKVTSISSSSTNTKYPSAKAVYDNLELKANHDNVAKNFWYGTQAEYDALATKDATTIYMTDEDTTTPIATSITPSSTNDEVASAKAVYDFAQDNYSTTEQVVGTWIDGKPLYKITYQFVCSTTNPGQVTQDLTNLNFEKITEISGIAEMQQIDTYYRNISNTYAYNSPTVTEFSGVWVNGETLYYRYSGYNGLNSFNAYITLYYTKTTD